MGALSNVGRSVGVARDALGAITLKILVYPVLASVLGILMPVGFLWLGALVGGPYMIGGVIVIVIVAVYAIVFSFLMVAYCYELNEVFEGRSPAFGDGFGVATERFRLVVLAGLIVGVGGFAARLGGNSVPFGDLIGVGSKWGLRIAGVFAFPVVATTRTSAADAFQEVLDAAEQEWGKSIVAAASTRVIGLAIFWICLFGAVALAVLAFFGRFAVEFGPLGTFTLPVIVAVGGLILATSVQFTLEGILRTALFRYASDGRLPAVFSSNPDALVDKSDAHAQTSNPTPRDD